MSDDDGYRSDCSYDDSYFTVRTQVWFKHTAYPYWPAYVISEKDVLRDVLKSKPRKNVSEYVPIQYYGPGQVYQAWARKKELKPFMNCLERFSHYLEPVPAKESADAKKEREGRKEKWRLEREEFLRNRKEFIKKYPKLGKDHWERCPPKRRSDMLIACEMALYDCGQAIKINPLFEGKYGTCPLSAPPPQAAEPAPAEKASSSQVASRKKRARSPERDEVAPSAAKKKKKTAGPKKEVEAESSTVAAVEEEEEVQEPGEPEEKVVKLADVDLDIRMDLEKVKELKHIRTSLATFVETFQKKPVPTGDAKSVDADARKRAISAEQKAQAVIEKLVGASRELRYSLAEIEETEVLVPIKQISEREVEEGPLGADYNVICIKTNAAAVDAKEVMVELIARLKTPTVKGKAPEKQAPPAKASNASEAEKTDSQMNGKTTTTPASTSSEPAAPKKQE